MAAHDVTTSALLTPEQAATALNLSARTLARNIRAGQIRVVRIGRLVRIEPQEIRRVIDANRPKQEQA